jgi:hypothetical protein
MKLNTHRGGEAAIEEQVPPGLGGGAGGTQLGWRAVLVEEVCTGAQPVDVEEVSEDLRAPILHVNKFK